MTKSVADYENAAFYYAKLIENKRYFFYDYVIYWKNSQFTSYTDVWSALFNGISSSSELISIMKLTNSTYTGTQSQLNLLSRDKKLKPSEQYKSLSDNQVYCFKEETSSVPKFTLGDLRYRGAILTDHVIDSVYNATSKRIGAIAKYSNSNIMIYRKALLYLRYAEAVNRAGKPTLSFAVLKYGLNSTNLADKSRIASIELADNKPYVEIFKDKIFDFNMGVHTRGSGNSTLNTAYVIPNYTRYVTLKDIHGNDSIAPTKDLIKIAEAKSDTILFVENAICDELALETAMEGNRFQDLMRISNHRNNPAFLADKVAKKHKTDYSHFYEILKDKNEWYLPIK
ncbi:MAG: RagB/SusD family nutrient uptake outer membrane protein [Paludibacteraceae bacterium]